MNAVKVIISQKRCKLVIGSLMAYETPPFSVTSFLLVSCKHFQMHFCAAMQPFNSILSFLMCTWSARGQLLRHGQNLTRF